MHRILWLVLASWVVPPALAGPGDLDVRFGTHGQAEIPGQLDSSALIALPNGRILVFGKSDDPTQRALGSIAVARLLASGQADTTFGSGGHLDLRLGSEPEPVPADALLLADGRILVAGYFTGDADLLPSAAEDQRRRTRAAGWIVRLAQDGTIDPTFGVGGVGRAGGGGLDRIALLPDGAIVAAAPGMLHRLESNGAPAVFPGSESSAVAIGMGWLSVSTMASLHDGSVITSAHFSGPMDSLELSRISVSGGARDLDWRYVTHNFGDIRSFGTDSDGMRLTVCGSSAGSLVIVRAQSDGRPDPGFAPATDNRVALVVDTRSDLHGNLRRDARCRSVLPGPADDQVIVGDLSNDNEYGGGSILLAHLDASGALDAASHRSGRIRELEIGTPDQWSSWYVPDATRASDGAVLFIARRTTAAPPDDYYFRNELGEQRTLIARVEVSSTAGSGALGFNDAAVRVAERRPTELSVYRSGGSTGSVSVRYELLHDTADELDIAPLTGTLTWPDGDASPRTIELVPVNDAALEGEEHFRIRLTAPSGGAGLATPVIEVTIEDDEVLRAMQFADPVMQVVEARTADVTITPPATPGPIVVRYAVTPDFEPLDGAPRPAVGSRLYRKDLVGQLRWSAGDTTPRTVQVNTFGTGNQQPNDTIYVALADVSGTLREGNDWKAARVTVVDDPALNDPPPPPPPSPLPSQSASAGSGGGGAISLAALLLLALTRLASALRLCYASRRPMRAECGDAP